MSWIRELGRRLRAGSAPPSALEAIPDPARVVVGLGNPGARYEATRHNIGFRVVERLAEGAGAEWVLAPPLEARIAAAQIAGVPCLLVEPLTFMNRSGQTVAAICERWPSLDPTSDLLVVFDDLDLPTGRIRLRPSGGGGGHNGIGDILERLGTRTIPRLRFGVGHPGASGEVIDWVLGEFDSADEALIAAAVERAVAAIELALSDGVPAAMGQFNAAS